MGSIACGSVALSLRAVVGMAAVVAAICAVRLEYAARPALRAGALPLDPGGRAAVGGAGTGRFRRLSIEMGFLLDPLSAVMLFVVTFVGFLIHVYSVGYMSHEAGFQRYLRLSEPVHGGDAAAGSGQQLPGDVRRLGGRRVCARTC